MKKYVAKVQNPQRTKKVLKKESKKERKKKERQNERKKYGEKLIFLKTFHFTHGKNCIVQTRYYFFFNGMVQCALRILFRLFHQKSISQLILFWLESFEPKLLLLLPEMVS